LTYSISGTLIQAPIPESTDRRWTPGPLHPRLAAGAVHVWRAELTVTTDDLIGLLSNGERERAEGILQARNRRLWMRTRGVLRALLGRYLQLDPCELRFATGARGKPALLEDAEAATAAEWQPASAMPPQLSFNLSHSGQLALYAFTRAGDVGVDVEVARRPIDEIAIAARAFGPAEARRLEGHDPAIRRREFLHAWVRHEAACKLRGTGIGPGGSGACVTTGLPWICELDVGSRAAGAVALDRPPRELRCWDWSGRPPGARARGS
jgi:4'-phosphopantetheinyl transferase